MTEEQTKTREIPPWVSIALIALCLAGGVAFVVWQWRGEPDKERVVVNDPRASADPMRPMPNRQGRRMANAPGRWRMDPAADGVMPMGNPGWRVKSGYTVMAVAKQGQNRDFVYGYLRPLNAAPETSALRIAQFRLLHDPTMAQTLKVTPDQMARLKALPELTVSSGVPGVAVTAAMKIETADRERLISLWNTYEQAAAGPAKAQAEKALLAGLDELGKKNLEPTRQEVAALARQIKVILTPAQWGAFTPNPAASSMPSATPPPTSVPAGQ